MSVILITANFKFQNRSTCSKEPMKGSGKVCGDSQHLKSPGMDPGYVLVKVRGDRGRSHGVGYP